MGAEHNGDCRRPAAGAPPGRVFLAALGGCTLLSAAFLGVLLEAPNRQDLFWCRADTLALFLVILVASTGICAGILLLDRLTRGRWARWGRPGVYLLATLAIVQLVPPDFLGRREWPVDAIYWTVLGAGLVATAISACRRQDPLAAALWRGSQGLSVLFPLLLVHLLRLPPFVARTDLDAGPAGPRTATSPSVVLFVFDSISMAQCLDANGRWRADLPALADLRADAVCFDRAVSCGPGTTTSLPNLLFQRSPEEYSDNIWDDAWFGVDPRVFTNGLFYSARQAGYRTDMLGLYLPFGRMFGPLLDGALDFPLTRYVAPDSFLHRCANQVVCLVAYARGPFKGTLVAGLPRLRHVPGWLNEGYYRQMVRRQEERVRALLASWSPAGRLFVSYLPIPHSPAIFLPDGTVDSLRATYDSQLRYTDRVLGTFLATLKNNGTYDASWVILTSDHGHHAFDLPPDRHRHVPFIVKPPGSAPARVVDSRIRLWELAPFFRAVFAGVAVADGLAALPVELDLD